jgi:hypothetical protein
MRKFNLHNHPVNMKKTTYPNTDLLHEVQCRECPTVFHCTCGSISIHYDVLDMNVCGLCIRTKLSKFTNPDPLCPQCGRQFCEHKGNEVKFEEHKPWSQQSADEWNATRDFLMGLARR